CQNAEGHRAGLRDTLLMQRDGMLLARRAIHYLWSYDAANAYGAIDCLRSYDVVLLTELLNRVQSHILS
ncbi:hypothetical protein HAX54_019151, partial [Datura stramonium]|nr:hypothetical protein [Datura stramonium]